MDQAWLLPPSVHQLVPPGRLAHFVRDTVREALDLSAVTGVHKAEQGQPPCRRSIHSSRQLARACEERTDMMALTGLDQPDFRTIGDFRKRHLPALRRLFVQVPRLRQAAGLVKPGHVAVDGAKLRASAGKHKAMSHKRMANQEPKLAAEVASWLGQAEAADAAEDAQHGPGCRGDEMPDWMAGKQRRLARIRAAKAQLEAEAKAGPGSADPDGPGPSSGMQERGARKDKAADTPPDPTPPDRTQRNLTDGDSRIVPGQGGSIAGHNGQIAVDAAHQVVVAQRLIANPADFAGLAPPVGQARANLGRCLREMSGDTGFAAEANLGAMAERGIRACLSPGRIRHGDTDPTSGRVLKRKPRMQAMAETICRAGRRSRCRMRKQVVEPAFGQVKQAKSFRQFLLRGLTKVRGEWAMVRTAHNLLKLHRAAA